MVKILEGKICDEEKDNEDELVAENDKALHVNVYISTEEEEEKPLCGWEKNDNQHQRKSFQRPKGNNVLS